MAPKSLTFAMLFLSCILVLGNLPGISANCNKSQLLPIIKNCFKFIHRGGPKIPPSQVCCSVFQGVDVPCLCNYVKLPIEALISVEKAIYVARTCGCMVPGGIKCGSYTVPPPDAPPPMA